MLKEYITESANFGRQKQLKNLLYDELPEDSGVNRQIGSEGNKQIRDYAVSLMRELDLEITIDNIGNIFGKLSGSDPDAKSVMCGSHLDSVSNGGIFDGALGVFSAIEAVRILKKQNFQNRRAIEIVVFTA